MGVHCTLLWGLTVIWPFGSNFDPKHSLSFCNNYMYKTQTINQESSAASDFEFPCKPLLGPSPS